MALQHGLPPAPRTQLGGKGQLLPQQADPIIPDHPGERKGDSIIHGKGRTQAPDSPSHAVRLAHLASPHCQCVKAAERARSG